MQIEEMRKELEKIRSILMLERPFLAAILRRLRIIADERVPTFGVNVKNELRINPNYYQGLFPQGKATIYSHEGLHVAFLHPQRRENKEDEPFQLAADCVVNSILLAHGAKLEQFPGDPITPEKIAKIVGLKEELVAKMSMEELYWLILKNKGKIKSDAPQDLLRGDGKSDESKEKVIQEGDPEAYKPGKTGKEMEEFWRKAISQALVEARMAGRLPGEVERAIGELIKPKQRWQDIAKKELVTGLGNTVVSSWQIPSRKNPGYPGIKHLSSPTVFIYIDTSGSIGIEKLKQFLGIVFAVCSGHRAKIIIIPWDAKAYPPIVIRKKSDIRAIQLRGIPGGGGTVIAPALAQGLKAMKPRDISMILTDGDIADSRKEETQELFRKIGKKSSLSLFISLSQQIDLPRGWRKIKIEN